MAYFLELVVTDYIYIPMGGSRVCKFRHFFNLLFVFLISGIWHGAAWNFILWGLWFALLCCCGEVVSWVLGVVWGGKRGAAEIDQLIYRFLLKISLKISENSKSITWICHPHRWLHSSCIVLGIIHHLKYTGGGGRLYTNTTSFCTRDWTSVDFDVPISLRTPYWGGNISCLSWTTNVH